ncbi:MAG TPA: undecaprenyldiphospho-muramoylpentapeptide beta-N-acetylglucosaminyltransferase [Burkholderiaceae bacterium]|nr:undecaprenyldiphospho-muramoylpentapeptide beta-N-acetylglucosaminyltransferase [Burkholderiaceae bacterium]
MSARNGTAHLTVVAAGTGGHVMPGLAVAEALRARGWSVSWLGTRAGMERSLVEPRGIAFDAVDFAGLRGKGLKTLLAGGFHLLRALGQSLRILRARPPAVVFSTGGYVAVPAGLATALTGAPLVLLNADAAPLLSTRMLKVLAAAICCGFDGGAARLAGAKGLISGNPVRPEIAGLDTPAARYAGRRGALNLLAVGGSLGARVLNETLPAALALLARDERPHVVHQCGAAHVEATRAAYAAAGVTAEVLPFIDDIARRYAAADLVICRAGAITVAELCAAGVPAVLVPFVVRTTQHQRSNAQWLAQHGGAIHVPQEEFDPARVAAILRGLTREQLVAMAASAKALGRPQATTTVADAIERVARARRRR